MDEQQTPTAGSPIYQESQEKNAKWLWLLIILIIIGALAFAVFKGIGPFAKFSPFIKTSASPTPAVVASPIISESSPSPDTNLDKSKPSIRVLNGSGTAGKASAVKDFLEGLGYKVASIGNADSYDFEKSEVRFKEDFKQFEVVIVEDLSQKYSATASSDDLESSDSADIEVIVGSE